MNRSLVKRGRKRLPPEVYKKLWNQILRRDGWRCQSCDRSDELQVHHLKARAQLGEDREDNLMTLCSDVTEQCIAGIVTPNDRRLSLSWKAGDFSPESI